MAAGSPGPGAHTSPPSSNIASGKAGITGLTDLQNQVSSYQSRISNLTSQVRSDALQIANLQYQISADNSQISSLQFQVASLQEPFLSGEFTSTTNCPPTGGCTYLISGAVANSGTEVSNSSTVTFGFYSLPGSAGQQLCNVTAAIGNIPGRTVVALPSTTCYSSYGTPAQSYGWAFGRFELRG